MIDKQLPLEAQFKLDSVRSNLLTYLGHSPLGLKNHGPDYAGDLALSLGNALVWIAGTVEPYGAIEEPLGRVPSSIHSLGKQFQIVGRGLLDKSLEPQEEVYAQLNRLRLEVQSLRKMVLHKIGGAK